MKLYFMRHGYAEPAQGKLDEERNLTEEGVKRVENAATVIARMQIMPKHIFSSPRVRAKQTADIVAAALDIPVEVRDEVNFHFSDTILHNFVQAYPDQNLMFVGHEPTLTSIVEALTHANVVMKPGSLACVEITSSMALRGELLWLIAPKVFDAVAGE